MDAIDADLPYCGSDCTAADGVALSLAAMVKMNFLNVAMGNFSSYIQPNTLSRHQLALQLDRRIQGHPKLFRLQELAELIN